MKSTYIVRVNVKLVPQGVDSMIPVQWFVDSLNHANIAEFVCRVDQLCHPLEPLDGSTVVVIIIKAS